MLSKQAMHKSLKGLKNLLILICFVGLGFAARADNCAICGQPIEGKIYLWTDKVTGQKVEVCSTCNQLPNCFICGLPVKDGTQLSDGRWLCARDAKTAVMDIDDVQRIFWEVRNDVDQQYSRFTSFPTNI